MTDVAKIAASLSEADDPDDECVCGDRRRDHPNNGPCRFNGRGSDLCHGWRDCTAFRLAGRKGRRGDLIQAEREGGQKS